MRVHVRLSTLLRMRIIMGLPRSLRRWRTLTQDRERKYGNQQSSASTCRYKDYAITLVIIGCSVTALTYIYLNQLFLGEIGLINRYVSKPHLQLPLLIVSQGRANAPCRYQTVVRTAWFLDRFGVSLAQSLVHITYQCRTIKDFNCRLESSCVRQR